MRINIDSRELDLPAGTTILQAAAMAGVEIPTLCFVDGCEAMASCFLCIVKVDGRVDLLPACATPAADGMVVHTAAPEVLAARRTCLELLLSDHVGDCVAPCEGICPAHMEIPRMLRLIAAGQLAQAGMVARGALVLPVSLGRVCTAPCEKGCRRAGKDGSLAIRRLHRLAGELALCQPAQPPARNSSGKSVAVIGAGPAGLAVAYHLLQRGYACTVMDEHDCPGGMLRYGVGDGRLPPAVLDAEASVIGKMGATFRMGVRVGRTLTLAELREQFAAVVLATGPLGPGDADLLGVEVTPHGVGADEGHATNLPGVFAAGDVIRKHRLAVRAVGDGASAAACVDQFLMGKPVHGIDRPFSCHIGPVKDGEMDAFVASAGASPDRRIVIADQDSVSERQARDESARCLHCDCRKADGCRLRQHCQTLGADAHKYRGGARRLFQAILDAGSVIYEPGKCIACGLCVQITERSGQKLGLAMVGRGYDARPAVPFGRSLSEALGAVADQCVTACPTAALAKK